MGQRGHLNRGNWTRDLENGSVYVGRQDLGGKQEGMSLDEFVSSAGDLLQEIQKNLFEQRKRFRRNIPAR